MKKLYLLSTVILLFIASPCYAQHVNTRNGNLKFEGSTFGYEEVSAKTNTVSAVLDTSSGAVASLVFINAFQFKVGLMQEHFNENYMESTTYPKATFKGKLKDFDSEDLLSSPKKYVMLGEITIRNVTKAIEVNCTLKKVENVIFMDGEFIIHPEDFNIEIPNLVREKIAKEIQVTFNYNLKS